MIRAVYADKTGVGDYIFEDMMRGGLLNVTSINFTDTSKEAMATALKENMRRADCPSCGWSGLIEDVDGEWRTMCPEGTHDDRFWALALSVYASEMAPPPASRPIGKII